MLFEIISMIEENIIKKLIMEKQPPKIFHVKEEKKKKNRNDIETGYYYKDFPNLQNNLIEILDLELGYGLNSPKNKNPVIINITYQEEDKIYPLIENYDYDEKTEEQDISGELHKEVLKINA